jgi:hypothetical protein
LTPLHPKFLPLNGKTICANTIISLNRPSVALRPHVRTEEILWDKEKKGIATYLPTWRSSVALRPVGHLLERSWGAHPALHPKFAPL